MTTGAKTNSASSRVGKLSLTRSELELLEVEIRASIENGGEDPDYPTILRKVRIALGWRSDSTETKQ